MIMKVKCTTTKMYDQCTTNTELRKRKVHWQQRFKTFFPNGLNELEESCL